MQLNEFLKYRSKIQKVELPTPLAHAKMTPSNRLELLKECDFDQLVPKKASVMMLFYSKEDIMHLALILRTSYNGVHSSQIAFPGGKVELEDTDLQQTALRETHEEIGIHPTAIEVIRSFTPVYIPPSNFMVYPYLGYSNQKLDFTLQDEEVAGLVELPLPLFLDDAIVKTKIMSTSYAKDIVVPGFQVDNHFVWGATAMMMSELKETLKMVL